MKITTEIVHVIALNPESREDVEALRSKIAAQQMAQNVSFETVQKALRALIADVK